MQHHERPASARPVAETLHGQRFLRQRQRQRHCIRHGAVGRFHVSALKLKFHWDQFPRNFPVANVTGKSPTSYGEVGRVASLLRGS